MTSSYQLKRMDASEINTLSPEVLDRLTEMGKGSAKAQGLNQELTSISMLKKHADHRLYLLLQEKNILGILKVGEKHLYYMVALVLLV